MFFTYENFDPKNLTKIRNIKNTDKWEYNCGGYALSTYSWYTPFEEEREICLCNHHMYREIEKEAVAHILSDFPELKLVEEESVYNKVIDYTTNEIIAFRFSNYDFHFWKLGKNGKWYDKMGGLSTINIHRYFDVFKKWGLYGGKLYFFTRPRA